MRALISVYDKTGVAEFARGLVDLGFEVVSSGGTATALEEAGLAVTTVEEVTGFPEMLGGRVKTLHPRVHAGILARRGLEEDLAAIAEHGIELFDLVCVNLYPFELAVDRPELDEEGLVEMIDVGGPALLRAAAKSFASVLAVCRPQDYAPVLAELWAGQGASTPDLRRRLAAVAFARTAAYDAAIARWFQRGDALPGDVRAGVRPRARALVRREPPPERRLLRGARREDAPALVRRAASGEAALVQQPERPLGREAPRRGAGRPCVRDREAREPVRRRRRGDDRGRVRESARGGSRVRVRRRRRPQPRRRRGARGRAREPVRRGAVRSRVSPEGARDALAEGVAAHPRAHGAARRRRGGAGLPARDRRAARPAARRRRRCSRRARRRLRRGHGGPGGPTSSSRGWWSST